MTINDRPPGKPWTLAEAAEFLNCSTSKIEKLVYAGKIPTIKIGRLTRIADAVLRDIAEFGITNGNALRDGGRLRIADQVAVGGA